ncbi:uncharacterized protein LOC62_01G000683 [Vanrija pseudolonga]|uniref:Uncharacterized protein n=1 Tax=Vanrija pseudolonga TaxID=143232 RepID=A0AAF0Y3R7_9TREE|nr:hypothetical protein LOC62_01G000683 [Vanrija pseudolonga]
MARAVVALFLGLWLALALLASPARAAFNPTLRVNWTFSAADPAVNYRPSDTVPLNANWGMGLNSVYPAWNVSYGNASAPAAHAQSQAGSGAPVRSTRAGSGTSIEAKFLGSAVWFHGRVDPRAFAPNRTAGNTPVTPPNVFVDVQTANVSASTTDVIWGTDDELPWGFHDVQLNIDGNWTVDNVLITYAVQTQAPTFADMTTHVEPTVLNGTVNPFYTAQGAWNVSTQPGADGQPYSHIVGGNVSVLTFPVPANTSFLVVNGTTGPKMGSYIVALTPAPPLSETSSVFNARSAWEDPVVLYATPLDPAVQYTAQLSSGSTGLPGDNAGHGYHAVTFYSGLSDIKPPAEPSKKASHTGAIVGGVIGGVALLVIIAALAFCLGRRRHPAPEPEAAEAKTASLEDEHGVLPTPYVSERERTAPFVIDDEGAAAAAPPDTLTTTASTDEYHTARTDLPPLSSPTRSSPGSSTAYLIAKGETLAAMSARGSAQSSPITPTTPGGAVWPAVAGASARTTKSARGVTVPTAPAPVPEPRPRRVEQEQDAGSLDEPEDEEELEPELVPPSYNPDWAARRDDSASPSPSPTRPPAARPPAP